MAPEFNLLKPRPGLIHAGGVATIVDTFVDGVAFQFFRLEVRTGHYSHFIRRKVKGVEPLVEN